MFDYPHVRVYDSPGRDFPPWSFEPSAITASTRSSARARMGVVYRAYDTRLHRTVAIKRLQDASAEVSGTAVARRSSRRRHAESSEHLHHSRSRRNRWARVHRDGVRRRQDAQRSDSEARPPARDRARVRAGRSPTRSAFAHAGGIVHRDLKGSNIVITPEGDPRSSTSAWRCTCRQSIHDLSEVDPRLGAHAADVAGTPAYMSPEALRGERSNPRSDVWSLGIVSVRDGHRSSPVR